MLMSRMRILFTLQSTLLVRRGSQRGSARPIVTDEADCKDPQLSTNDTQTAEAEKPINFTPAGMHGSISAVICHKDKLGISLCTFNNIDGVYIAEINNDKGEFHRGNVWPGDKLIGVYQVHLCCLCWPSF